MLLMGAMALNGPREVRLHGTLWARQGDDDGEEHAVRALGAGEYAQAELGRVWNRACSTDRVIR